MPSAMPARDVLDREFLEMRAKILQLAASLDRMHRGEGSVTSDPRIKDIHEAIGILTSAGGDRAERVQLLFSRAYDEGWRTSLNV